jgi:hypothetical protein
MRFSIVSIGGEWTAASFTAPTGVGAVVMWARTRMWARRIASTSLRAANAPGEGWLAVAPWS